METISPVSELQYPIGKFQPRENYTYEQTLQSIDNISKLPALYSKLVDEIKNKLYQTYREEGWTGLQVINHLIDTYINGIMRTKWLLAEENPDIKPYDEQEFSKLPDSTYENIEHTMQLLKLLIERWVFLLRSLPAESFTRTTYHPEYKEDYTLHKLIAMYDWHGYHHLAHLQIIKCKN